MGAPFRQPEWSAEALIEAPDTVKKAHQHFLEAGSGVITVNSYACVPFHLGEERFRDWGDSLIHLAADIARQSADEYGPASVAGCIPPPLGSYKPELFNRETALPILSKLVKNQAPFVDLWLAETISSIAEIQAIAEVLDASTLPRWFAFSLTDHIEKRRGMPTLRSGEPVDKAVEAALEAGADAVLFNCSVPEVMLPALETAAKILAAQNSNVQLGAYANAFLPIQPGHSANLALQETREITSKEYLDFARQWCAAGATIVGGCCGITPAHIKALDELNNG